MPPSRRCESYWVTPWSVCLSQIDYDEGVGMHEKTLGIGNFPGWGGVLSRGRVLVESEIIESLYFENAVKQCETMKHIYII